jgi:hypothetical protein
MLGQAVGCACPAATRRPRQRVAVFAKVRPRHTALLKAINPVFAGVLLPCCTAFSTLSPEHRFMW